MVGPQTTLISRRALLASALAPAAAQTIVRPPAAEVRSYTATAIVSFLGVTLLTRRGAAGGFARAAGENGETVIEFAAGSHPDRCAGINRLGYIRESCGGSGGRRKIYGFMTVSREESFQEARKALGSAGPEQPFVLIDSTVDSAGCESHVASVSCSSALRWPDWRAVEVELMKRWPSAPKRVARLPGAMPGFLSAVRTAMMQGGSGSLAYAHNDKQYALNWTVARARHGIAELDGRISGHGKARFKVWFDPSEPGAPPLAFEYQPKSYLRVRFDAVTGEQS